MERTQYDWQHQYLLTPQEYPISANENHSTYDQFIQLRDTLIFTWKYYNDKASRKLCVGDKWDWTTTNTIEVWLPNYYRQSFNQDWQTNRDAQPDAILLPKPYWGYVTLVPWDIMQQYNFPTLSAMINKDGHYRIMHKEEILLTATDNKVFCYVDVYRKDGQWVYKIPQDKRGWVAVYDREWNTSLSWQTSWTDPNGSCTVPITLGKLFKKMTASSTMEVDLLKDDIIVLRFQNGTYDPNTWEPTGTYLTVQDYSNYLSIEYLDLPYNI